MLRLIMRNNLLLLFFITVVWSPFVCAKNLYFAGFSFWEMLIKILGIQ